MFLGVSQAVHLLQHPVAAQQVPQAAGVEGAPRPAVSWQLLGKSAFTLVQSAGCNVWQVIHMYACVVLVRPVDGQLAAASQ